MIWTFLYRAGIIGFLLAIVIAGAVSIGEVLNLADWPISEGNSVVRIGVQFGLGFLMVCGIALLIPSLGNVFKSGQHDSFDRYLWAFLLVFFPYAAPYIYYRKYLRVTSHESGEAEEEGRLTNAR